MVQGISHSNFGRIVMKKIPPGLSAEPYIDKLEKKRKARFIYNIFSVIVVFTLAIGLLVFKQLADMLVLLLWALPHICYYLLRERKDDCEKTENYICYAKALSSLEQGNFHEFSFYVDKIDHSRLLFRKYFLKIIYSYFTDDATQQKRYEEEYWKCPSYDDSAKVHCNIILRLLAKSEPFTEREYRFVEAISSEKIKSLIKKQHEQSGEPLFDSNNDLDPNFEDLDAKKERCKFLEKRIYRLEKEKENLFRNLFIYTIAMIFVSVIFFVYEIAPSMPLSSLLYLPAAWIIIYLPFKKYQNKRIQEAADALKTNRSSILRK